MKLSVLESMILNTIVVLVVECRNMINAERAFVMRWRTMDGAVGLSVRARAHDATASSPPWLSVFAIDMLPSLLNLQYSHISLPSLSVPTLAI